MMADMAIPEKPTQHAELPAEPTQAQRFGKVPGDDIEFIPLPG